MPGDGVGVRTVGNTRARDGPGLTVDVDEGLLIRVVGRLDLNALGGLDHVDALEAAAVQAVVHGRAGHHVVAAAVVLVDAVARVAVDLVGAGDVGRVVDVLGGPVLRPGQRRVAVGVLGHDGVLLVVGLLQRVVGRGDNRVGRDGRGRDRVDALGAALGVDLVDDAGIGRAALGVAVDGLVHAVPVVVAQVVVVADLDLGDLAGGDGDLNGHIVAIGVPLVARVQRVVGIREGGALVRAVSDLAQVVR